MTPTEEERLATIEQWKETTDKRIDAHDSDQGKLEGKIDKLFSLMSAVQVQIAQIAAQIAAAPMSPQQSQQQKPLSDAPAAGREKFLMGLIMALLVVMGWLFAKAFGGG